MKNTPARRYDGRRITLLRLSFSSLLHYLGSNLFILLGTAVSTAIITGAFIVGDSVGYSLEKAVDYRLGDISYTITAGERFFTTSLAGRINEEGTFSASSGMMLDAVALADGGQLRLNGVRVIGIDSNFATVSGAPAGIFEPEDGEAVISENVAARLNLKVGDMLLLRMRKASVMPLNAPLVSDDEQTVARQVTVRAIAGRESFGRFNLQVSQTAPMNVFVKGDWLNGVMGIENMANVILVKGEGTQNSLESLLVQHWQPEDLNLRIQYHNGTGEWEVSSERVFLDTLVSSSIMQSLPQARPVLTYFVNSIRLGQHETPYSFVSGPFDDLPEDEIIINKWTADDIMAEVGDTLTLEYYEVGPLSELTVRQAAFRVRSVTGMEGIYGDRGLMPGIPGLADARSCSEWEAGIPIDLGRIRDKDEQYWNTWKGTPKAFISLAAARRLWGNRFGDLTAIRIGDAMAGEEEIRRVIKDNTDIFALGFQVNELKKKGLEAAAQGVDFGQLFLGLSFFILLSGVLLAALLIIFSLGQRAEQTGTFVAMGFSHRLIRRIYLLEGMAVALAGALAGTALAVVYGKLVFRGLNRVWQDIVRTDVLEISIQPWSLAGGFMISMLLAWGVTAWLVRRHLTMSVIQLQQNLPADSGQLTQKMKRLAVILLSLTCTGLLSWQAARGGVPDPAVFLVCGALLMAVFLLLSDLIMRRMEHGSISHLSMTSLSIKNMIRNRGRSLTVIILLSLGIFTVVATGSNRRDLASDADNPSSGTGGFDFVAESTVPVIKNLELAEVRREFGLPDSLNIVPFMVHEGDDASCLNLNRISNPRMLGVNLSLMKGRFSFASATEDVDPSDPWSSLENRSGNVIPGIADQTVIQWGLGKKTGDTLRYVNEFGDSLYVKLVGGLAASVLQGQVIISASHLLREFPTASGTRFFLIESGEPDTEKLTGDMQLAMGEYGWDMEPAVSRLAEFASVQNTYLQIFVILGAFGLLLGTMGLAIVLARSMAERKKELGIMVAAGYLQKDIFRIVVTEYSLMLLAGMAGGMVPAVLSSLPSYLSGSQNIPAPLMGMLLGIILLNGLLWIFLTASLQLRKMNLVSVLRND